MFLRILVSIPFPLSKLVVIPSVALGLADSEEDMEEEEGEEAAAEPREGIGAIELDLELFLRLSPPSSDVVREESTTWADWSSPRRVDEGVDKDEAEERENFGLKLNDRSLREDEESGSDSFELLIDSSRELKRDSRFEETSE